MARAAVSFEASAAPAHRFPVRVYWEDTDAAGIVYYANYLKFMERARSDMVRAAGIDQAALLAEQGVVFGVRRCALDYLAPARLDDSLDVASRLCRLGGATIDLEQTVMRGHQDLVRASVQLACFDRQGRPRRLPGSVRAALQSAITA